MIEFDEIGLIVKDNAIMDSEGNVTTPATYLDGWYVNFTGVNDALQPFMFTPDVIVREFWGVPTFFGRFADQAEWEAIKEVVFPSEILE